MILDNFRLIDRVVVVTGAGQGIGRGIALGLAEAGADVVVAARTASDLDEVVAEIEARGRRGLAVPTDVMQEDDRAALYLAAPASPWVTGKIFQVDGGVERPAIEVPVPPLEPTS